VDSRLAVLADASDAPRVASNSKKGRAFLRHAGNVQTQFFSTKRARFRSVILSFGHRSIAAL
jgi:hypothetical protein